MNERIEKLANQAGINFSEMAPIILKEEIEKFAKLVIEECGEVAFCHSHVSGYALKEIFKKHFKVK